MSRQYLIRKQVYLYCVYSVSYLLTITKYMIEAGPSAELIAPLNTKVKCLTCTGGVPIWPLSSFTTLRDHTPYLRQAR